MAGALDPAARGHPAAAGSVAQRRQPPNPPPQHGGVVSCRAAARPQSRLHSFSFPSMSWGSQRLLRCVKVDPRGGSPSVDPVSSAESGDLGRQGVVASAPPRRREGAGCGRDGDGEGKDEGLRKSRYDMTAEFQKAVEGIPQPKALGFQREESKGGSESSPSPAVEEASRPWNLRLRRSAACSAPSEAPDTGVRKAKNQDQGLMAPEKVSAATKQSGRVRRWEAVSVKDERPRFSSALSKDEIEEDFFLMTGSRPPRPRKRPRNVQKHIEALCPGFYLTEITPDLYKTSQGH